MKQHILLSGIKPSADDITVGNYLGAIKKWVELQEHYLVVLFIADAHAITVPQDPKKLRENTLKSAMLLLACGIDPKKGILFIQSHVPEHFEFAWILNTITPVGELERMVQFKEKSKEAGVLAGLLNYPVLQAADILLYKPDVVPVGEDQLQHLELTRTLVRKFNRRFGKIFKEPKALLEEKGARIMALDDPTKKMSKSAELNNYIALLDSADEIRRKIKIAVTDSGREIRHDPEGKSGISNLLIIMHLFSGTPIAELEKKYKGKSYSEFKSDVAEVVVAALDPIQRRYRELEKDTKGIMSVLSDGARRARAISSQTLKEVKEKVGFLV